MKALIINYNRLTLAARTADWIAHWGIEPIFVDNASDYGPLLDFYGRCPYQVLRLERNVGHTCVWDMGLLDQLGIDERYIITDPDLDFTGIPKDWLKVFNAGLDKYPFYHKCGFSLEINDLPDIQSAKAVREAFEAPYWRKPLDELYFEADIDTTFALYRPEIRTHTTCALRTNRPYTVRHVPWYYDHINDLPPDEQYYYRTCNGSASGSNRIRR